MIELVAMSSALVNDAAKLLSATGKNRTQPAASPQSVTLPSPNNASRRPWETRQWPPCTKDS